MKNKATFKFDLRQRVPVPRLAGTQAIITARGEDMDDGVFYTLEWLNSSGRPTIANYWEDELLAASRRSKPHTRTSARKSRKR